MYLHAHMLVLSSVQMAECDIYAVVSDNPCLYVCTHVFANVRDASFMCSLCK